MNIMIMIKSGNNLKRILSIDNIDVSITEDLNI